MKRPWLAYLLVALAACGAGVAIAGLPSSGNSVLLVPQTLTTTAETAESAPTTSTTVAPSTSAVPPTTAVPATTSTTTSIAPTTTTTSTTTTTTTTTTPTTTTPTTTTVAPPDTTTSTTAPPAPTDARVAVANGAGVPGLAGSAAELLTEAGFDDVAAIDSAPVDVTTVYYIEGFEEVAALVAVELFIDPDALADMSSAPDLETDEEFDVVAVLGADVGS